MGLAPDKLKDLIRENQSHPFGNVKRLVSKLIAENKIQLLSKVANIYPRFWMSFAHLEINEFSADGCGEGFFKSRSQERAIFESFERIGLKIPFSEFKNYGQSPRQSRKTSNGMCYATDVRIGLFNGYREIAERQIVLDAWLRNTKIYPLPLGIAWRVLNWTFEIQKKLKVNLLYFPNNFGLKVVCAVISQNKPPFKVFGFGSDTNLTKSIERATLEAWRLHLQWGNKYDTKNKFIKNYLHYANNDIPFSDIFEIGDEKETFAKSNSNVNNEIAIDIDICFLYNLEKIGLLGYVIGVGNTEFHDFFGGKLEQDNCLRTKGDIHPIA